MKLSLQGKVAVITGASSGIGKATALLFADLGASLVLFDIQKANLETVAREAEKKATCCKSYVVSVTDSEVLRILNQVSQEMGRIDILVSNAGIWEYVLFSELDDAHLDRMMNINFKGFYNIAKAVVPIMIKHRYGKIVCVSSVAGKSGSGVGASHYAASKGAVIAFARSLARELGEYNITVNAVCPGLIDTPMNVVVRESVGDRAEEAYVKGSILRRLGKPEEVAAVIAFLSSDLSSFVTGQAWNVCGGCRLD